MFSDSPIYLDNNASTPLAGPVLEAMMACARCQHANPSSSHRLGRKARQVVERSREELLVFLGANLLGREPDRLIFTSGATEANNLALRGLRKKGALVLSSTEHPSVSRLAGTLANEEVDVRWLKVDRKGFLCLEQLESWLHQGDVGLVSVIWANHETGVLQPMDAIAELCSRYGVLLHTDATQLATKQHIDLGAVPVSAMTFSAHKFHGPRGIGALFVRGGVALDPLMWGGFQQSGMRPGTESPVLATGIHEAWSWSSREAKREDDGSLVAMRDQLERNLKQAVPGIVLHGSGVQRGPQTLCFSVPGMDRQALFMALDQLNVACSMGAACESGSAERSPTLQAMGCSEELIGSALRLSVGHLNTPGQIDEALNRIIHCINDLQLVSSVVSTATPARREGSKMVD